MRGLGVLGEKILILVPKIIQLAKSLEKENKAMANQILRSGTSVGANCHEAQSAQSKADFITKLHIALKENDETQYWLKMFYASQLIDDDTFTPLNTEIEEIGKLLTSTIKHTKENLEISKYD
ncbi:MAG: four helix bundle protein [Paludibacteraceae bacterium]|nr:four helix bundle protein [Paludibacteraceae bacterium]